MTGSSHPMRYFTISSGGTRFLTPTSLEAKLLASKDTQKPLSKNWGVIVLTVPLTP